MEFKNKLYPEDLDKFSREEDRTILDLKPVQKFFLIDIINHCIATPVCKKEWNKDEMENTVCQIAAEFGKEGTREFFPEIDKMCSNRSDTFFFFLDKKLIGED